MRHELELYLRNSKVVAQTYAVCEKYPYRFWRNGMWFSQYVVHLCTAISGLSLRGLIEVCEDGNVETKLVFSYYGDFYLTPEEFKLRDKHVNHLLKYGATYKEEPKINWFE